MLDYIQLKRTLTIFPSPNDDSNGVARRDVLNARKLSNKDFQKWAKRTCSPKKKRSIVARKNIDVPVPGARAADPTDTLTTEGLSTCMGLVVTGTRKQGKTPHNHFMAHIQMDDTITKTMNDFKGFVNHAKPQLNNLKSYYTEPGLTHANLKTIMEQSKEPGETITDEDVDEYMGYLTEEYDKLIEQLEALAPLAGHTEHNPLTPHGNTMTSDGNGHVQVNGHQI